MGLPRVLVLADRPDWAFFHIAELLRGRLSDRFDITVSCEVHPQEVDLLVTLFWPMHFSALATIRARRAAVLCYDHLSWADPLSRHQLLLAVRRADVLGVGSEHLLSALSPLAREAERPIHLVEDGVDTDLFRPAPLPDRFTALWCGNSEAAAPDVDVKGLLLLQEACLRAEVPLQVLDVAQRGTPVPHKEMPAFYAGGSVYLCGSASEGTPNPVLEALACGRPVLSTDVGLVRKAVTPACGRILPRTAQAFAEALRELRDQDLTAMSAAARQAALEHDWRHKLPAWRRLLETALQAPDRQPPPPPSCKFVPFRELPRLPAPWLTGVPGDRATTPTPPAVLLVSPEAGLGGALPPEGVAPPVAVPEPERAAPGGPLVHKEGRPAGPPRPRVPILADVPSWAWARKARALRDQLGDRFDVPIWFGSEHDAGPSIARRDYALLHTFEVFQAGGLPGGVPFVTGITAHVWRTWEQRHGEGTVRAWAERALGVHANSRLLQREMESYLGRPVWYVPNGVDESFFRRTRPRSTDRIVVGFVGKDNPRKGYPIVAEACRRAGLELREVRRRSDTALSAEQMREFYQDIHVLAVSSDMDGTPNPALEAAACECAVVSNPIGNMPEFLVHGRNGLLTERSVESLTAALLDLARRPLEEVEEMGREARRTVEAGWTWKHMAVNYAEMWSACIRGREVDHGGLR